MTTSRRLPTQLTSDEIHVGHKIEPATHRPTTVQLFRYCAMTWNSHRIHFDKDYAASEGYPDVLVQSHLHGAFLTSAATTFAGELGRVEHLSYSVRRFAIPGDELVVTGEVTTLEPSEGGVSATIELRETREADSVVCAQGDATVWLPDASEGGES